MGDDGFRTFINSYTTEKGTGKPEDYAEETATLEVEMERYGSRKPRRVITRARIDHGKGPDRA